MTAAAWRVQSNGFAAFADRPAGLDWLVRCGPRYFMFDQIDLCCLWRASLLWRAEAVARLVYPERSNGFGSRLR